MKILIADDHAVVREGIKQILKSLPDVELIDEVDNGVDAYSKISTAGYDLIILDISMPIFSGLDILERMKYNGIKTPVLVLSFYPQEQYAMRAFKLGASGYLSKVTAFDELLVAIKKISTGGKYISASLAEKLIFQVPELDGHLPHEDLSEREFQVMIKLAKGKSLVDIGKEIFISPKTVSTYRMRIMEKMNFKSNSELTIYALKNSLIE